MEKKGGKKNKEMPVKEVKYSQSMEEMNQLIPFLKQQMSPCPTDDLVFILIETIDYYNLVRNFKLKSKTAKNDEAIKNFNNKLFSNISSLESFQIIPNLNSFEIEIKQNKGNKFRAPRIYNINAEEITLSNSGKEIILFLYKNLDELNAFISNNQNSNIPVFCLGINMNFFETKKKLKNSSLLNNKTFNLCFTDIKSSNSATNIKINDLPRIVVIGPDGLIREDKCVNVNNFDIEKNLINNKTPKQYTSEEQAKNDKFIYLENEYKRNVVKSMNIYLKNNGLNNVRFFVKSKICIDKKGIKKARCNPEFYGEASAEGKQMIDNLIISLKQQQLFNDIQCTVKYNKGK